jgi:hypothetical protein
MAVVLITITESPIQIVSGIPRTVVISTNIPATVFYTTDDTDPTIDSDVAVDAIYLPTDQNTVNLKLFATDGIDIGPIIAYTYATNQIGLRQAHSTVVGINAYSEYNNNRSFGQETVSTGVSYGNTGGVIVEKEWVAGIADGYDGTATGTVAVEPLESYHRTNYEIKYSTTNSKGETGRGIGNLPANIVIQQPAPIPIMSNANSSLFDPRALVIIQDGREESENPPMINRQFFNLGDQERIRNGIMYNTTAFEGNAATGSFLRPQYNAKDNTYTFYYRDSETNRWIMSIEPVVAASLTSNTASSNLVSNRDGNKVFRWIPFKRSIR